MINDSKNNDNQRNNYVNLFTNLKGNRKNCDMYPSSPPDVPVSKKNLLLFLFTISNNKKL